MNVEIGAEAAQFPEKEYINGIAVAVQDPEFLVLYCACNTFSLATPSPPPFCGAYPL
jgi:hypothetical protein